MPGRSEEGAGATEQPVAAEFMTPDLDPRRLMVFRAVGQHGSLAGAARTLGWTQPAVSQHVRRLERDLGMPLVSRVGRGIVLTDAGHLLLRHADTVAEHLALAQEAMGDLSALRTGRVRLAAFPSACATIVAAAAMTLHSDHPGLDLRLVQVEPTQALELLTDGRCDLAVTFNYGEQTSYGDDVEAVHLLDDPLRVVLPDRHPYRDSAEIRLDTLSQERWIAGCPQCRQHLLDSTARTGFQPDIRHNTDDYVVVQSLVAAGLAVAVLPGLALAAARHPGVVVRPITEQPPRDVAVLLRRGSRGIPAVATVVEHLTRAARRRPAAVIG